MRVVTLRELKFIFRFPVQFFLQTITNYQLLLYLEGKSVCLEVTLRVGELEPESFSVYLEHRGTKRKLALKS